MAKGGLYQFEANEVAAQFLLVDGTSIDINLDNLSYDVRRALMVHGLKQKIADAAAIPRDTETGKSATDAEKIAAMRRVAERLIAGEWTAAKGEGGAPRSLLQRALERLYPAKTREQIAEYLGTLDKKQQSALRLSPKVAPIIAELRDEAATRGGVDTDALLDGLMG